ncbi:unnamed protein product [Mesocestoides corti]|uniref:Uncharacterized protein n=1 Tax=Mesocestoides corti TaxID=53468 RepID=A0A3P6GSH5_MESCO|nr:unnamed protein product [Mesocestoides corti]
MNSELACVAVFHRQAQVSEYIGALEELKVTCVAQSAESIQECIIVVVVNSDMLTSVVRRGLVAQVHDEKQGVEAPL